MKARSYDCSLYRSTHIYCNWAKESVRGLLFRKELLKCLQFAKGVNDEARITGLRLTAGQRRRRGKLPHLSVDILHCRACLLSNALRDDGRAINRVKTAKSFWLLALGTSERIVLALQRQIDRYLRWCVIGGNQSESSKGHRAGVGGNPHRVLMKWLLRASAHSYNRHSDSGFFEDRPRSH